MSHASRFYGARRLVLTRLRVIICCRFSLAPDCCVFFANANVVAAPDRSGAPLGEQLAEERSCLAGSTPRRRRCVVRPGSFLVCDLCFYVCSSCSAPQYLYCCLCESCMYRSGSSRDHLAQSSECTHICASKNRPARSSNLMKERVRRFVSILWGQR